MARAPRDPAAGERVSLSLPATLASAPLARAAAIGLLAHRFGGAAAGARLAAVVDGLVGSCLARSRYRDRLRIHYDIVAESVLATVELRRRRWQRGGPFTERRSVPIG